jgi:hypothetical protein
MKSSTAEACQQEKIVKEEFAEEHSLGWEFKGSRKPWHILNKGIA